VSERTARDLAEMLLDVAGECAAEKLATALHMIVVSADDICDAFNRAVEQQRFADALDRQRLKPTSLRRLATKNGFGAN